uniref:Uncharacterized protein n=1 Tax=Oryza glumipatula TaxID=40148 RepID=A0A0E0BHC4_9ORYZ
MGARTNGTLPRTNGMRTLPQEPHTNMSHDIGLSGESGSETEEYDNDTSLSEKAEERIDRRLLLAARSGDSMAMRDMAASDPDVLLRTTNHGSNCLHISSIHGHLEFCNDVVRLKQPLLAAVNSYGETPLLAAVTAGHAALASELLRRCREFGLGDAVLKQDSVGCNALHHAIRGGHDDLALELIAAEPALSRAVNKNNESPMFIAAMRNSADIFDRLLAIPYSSHSGCAGDHALHAAARNGDSDIAKRVMETRPWLAKLPNRYGLTPMHHALLCDRVGVLRVLLEHDSSFGYVVAGTEDVPLLVSAAFQGRLGIAREILSYCPDASFRSKNGWTCLSAAVHADRLEFVEFVLGTPELQKLVSMRDNQGRTALHYAVMKCNPKMVAALLSHGGADVTMLDNSSSPPSWKLWGLGDHTKTLNWV